MALSYIFKGEPVLAARYTGSPGSVNAIMDMIGTMGVNNTELGLLINRSSPTYVKRGQWVVKLPQWKWWWIVEPKTFEAEYEKA